MITASELSERLDKLLIEKRPEDTAEQRKQVIDMIMPMVGKNENTIAAFLKGLGIEMTQELLK